MPAEYKQQRENVGRREVDSKGCTVHEARMDKIDGEIASNKGWLKGVSTLLLVVGFILSSFCTVIIGRLGTITDMLTDYRVMLKTHEIEISSLKSDVAEIKSRHNYIDQQRGVIK